MENVIVAPDIRLSNQNGIGHSIVQSKSNGTNLMHK